MSTPCLPPCAPPPSFPEPEPRRYHDMQELDCLALPESGELLLLLGSPGKESVGIRLTPRLVAHAQRLLATNLAFLEGYTLDDVGEEGASMA